MSVFEGNLQLPSNVDRCLHYLLGPGGIKQAVKCYGIKSGSTIDNSTSCQTLTSVHKAEGWGANMHWLGQTGGEGLVCAQLIVVLKPMHSAILR